jgi:hypothetical protein
MFDIPHPDEHSQPANANLKIMSIHWMLVYVQRANAGCIKDIERRPCCMLVACVCVVLCLGLCCVVVVTCICIDIYIYTCIRVYIVDS